MTRLYLLHGFMGTAETHFAPQIATLSKEFDLVPIDLPGHGSSQDSANTDYLAQATFAIRDKMEQEGPGWILGLSLGSILGMQLALNPPRELEGVIVTGFSPFIPKEIEPIMREQYDYFLNIEQHEPDIANHFEELHGPKWKSTVKAVLNVMTFNFPTLSEEMLQSIALPIFVLNGTEQSYEVEGARFLSEHIPNVTVFPIEKAGHTANLDQPERFNELLLHLRQSALTT